MGLLTWLRAAPGATDVAMMNAGFGGSRLFTPPAKGTAELLRAYSEMPWLRAIEHRVSSAVATVRWRVMRGTPGAKSRLLRTPSQSRTKEIRRLTRGAELEELETHPALTFLARANVSLDAGQSRKVTQMHLDLVGEGFWLIERNGLTVPTTYWPLPPTWVRDVPKIAGEQVFRVRPTGSGVETVIPATEIVWFKEADPLKPYERGVGTARSLSDELDTDEYAARFVKGFFYQDARPPLLVYGEGLGKDNTEAFEQKWIEKTVGFMRQFRPMFLNKKVEVKELGHRLRDMQLTQLREFERDLIVSVYGVPPEIMGLRENANRSTIDASDYHFAKWVIVPRMDLQRDALQSQLIPSFERLTGESLVLEYESPVTEDREFQREVAHDHPYAFDIDELRHLGGHNPRGGTEGELRPVPDGVRFEPQLTKPAPGENTE